MPSAAILKPKIIMEWQRIYYSNNSLKISVSPTRRPTLNSWNFASNPEVKEMFFVSMLESLNPNSSMKFLSITGSSMLMGSVGVWTMRGKCL